MTDCPWWFERDCEGRDCCECEFNDDEEADNKCLYGQ